MCVCVCTILHVFKTSTNLEKRNHASESFYVEELKIQSYYDVVHLCVSFCVSKFWMSVVFDEYPDDKSLLSRYLEDQYLEYMILKKNICWINIQYLGRRNRLRGGRLGWPARRAIAS